MADGDVRGLAETVREKLDQVVHVLEPFLNHYSLTQLNPDHDEGLQEFYAGFLSDLRHLLVFTEVSYEKLGNTLRRREFHVDHAEKVLYDTYYNCVNSFFYPSHESYSEDGRYAYTGQDAIRFRKPPTRVVRDLVIELSKVFEAVREELVYYETDYVTEKRLQKERA